MKQCFLVDFDGTMCETDLGDLIVHEATGKWWHEHVHRMGIFEKDLIKNNYAIWNETHLSPDDFERLMKLHARPRHGFLEWYQRCQELQHEVFVVSAGLEAYVRPAVNAWTQQSLAADRIISVPCTQKENRVMPDLERVFQSPLSSGYAKGLIAESIKKRFPGNELIAIGDGRSDMAMVPHCERVYARRYLAQQLAAQGTPFSPFDSFFEITPLRA